VRFALRKEPPLDTHREQRIVEAAREFAALSAGLEVALDRLAGDDLRGAELQLDEMQAVYGAEHSELWNFYGYLYTVEGNYGRAIDAYETAVAVALRADLPTPAPLVQLANLYFARHQYDMALKTLLRSNRPGGNRLVTAEADSLIQKLNALGVTEDTLQ
jgi:tetratricopeptide (TPR) repeat protein